MLLSQMEENRALSQKLQEAEAKLAEREITIAEAGTLAEAALKLNGVFAAADMAAKQYLENVKRLSDEAERRTKVRVQRAQGSAADE